MSGSRTLLYHKVTPRWDAGVGWTTPRQFERQMAALMEAGWRLGSWREESDREREFLIGFDDGYDCLLDTVLPILSRYGWTAAVFLPTNWIGRENDWDHQFFNRKFRHLDWEGVRRLADAGWEIGSHGRTHRDLTSLTEAELTEELTGSRLDIIDRVGRCEAISFPFRRFGERELRLAREAGYHRALIFSEDRQLASFGLAFSEVEPVYLWDRAKLLPERLGKTGALYPAGRSFRKAVNSLSRGTAVWRKIFPPKG